MNDHANNVGVTLLAAPAVLAATNTSDPLDTLGFAAATVLIATGAIVSDGNFTAKLQHSDTAETGDFVDVTATDLVGSFPASLAANSTVKVGYIGNRRYLRTVITKNSGTSIAASALAMKSGARLRPVA